MLDVDYCYEYAVGKEKSKEFTPLVKSINANAIHLQAPNSTGKTFLINLLAMGFFAQEIYESSQNGSGKNKKLDTNENGCISPTLINGIKGMTSLPTDKLRFDFTLTSKDGRTKLRAHKDIDNKRIGVYESIDGKESPISFHEFKKNYYLVYDFPKAPLERIPDMVSSIKSEQHNYKNKIFDLTSVVVKKCNAIQQFQEVDNNRRKYIAELENYKKELAKYREEQQELEKKISIFEEYVLLNKFNNAYKNYQNLSKKHYSIEQGKKKGKSNATKSINNYNEQKIKIENQLRSIAEKVAEFVNSIKQTDVYDKVAKQITDIENFDFIGCIEKGEYAHTNLENRLRLIKHKLQDWQPSKEEIEASSKSKIYNELLKVLKELRNTQSTAINIPIPGTDNKSLDQFIDILEDSCNKENTCGDKVRITYEVKSKIEELEKIINPENLQRDFEELRILKRKVLKSQNNLASINADDIGSDEREQDKKKLEELNTILLDCDDKLQKYYNIDVEKLLGELGGIPEYLRQFLSKYHDYKDELVLPTCEADLGKLISKKRILETQTIPEQNNRIQRHVGKISECENQTTPEYFEKSDELDILRNKIEGLKTKFTKYESYIDIIGDSKNTDKFGSLGDGGIAYNEKLSQYFGKSFTSIVFQKEYYKPVKIDLVTELITTDSGFEIPMRRLSTGESMSMYVQTVLNRQDDKRKLIVLFDESGTMDQKSFMPIREMLKPLVDDGKVMFALFVSKNETTLKIDTIA